MTHALLVVFLSFIAGVLLTRLLTREHTAPNAAHKEKLRLFIVSLAADNFANMQLKARVLRRCAAQLQQFDMSSSFPRIWIEVAERSDQAVRDAWKDQSPALETLLGEDAPSKRLCALIANIELGTAELDQ